MEREMIDIHTFVVPKWKIKGFDNYVIGNDNKLYNLRTNKLVHKKVKGYTKGYNLNGKFKSFARIRGLLIRYSENECPF